MRVRVRVRVRVSVRVRVRIRVYLFERMRLDPFLNCWLPRSLGLGVHRVRGS